MKNFYADNIINKKNVKYHKVNEFHTKKTVTVSKCNILSKIEKYTHWKPDNTSKIYINKNYFNHLH